MFANKMKNENGFTMIEMLLAMTLGIVVMGVAIFTYNKQSTVLRIGNQETQTRGMARLAMDALVKNIQAAGSGMPPGDSKINNGANPPVYTPRNAQGISKASSVAMTLLANTDNINTFIIFDPNPVAFPTITTFQVPPASANTGDPATTFAADDQVVIFDVSSPATTVRRVVQSVSSPTANFDAMVITAAVNSSLITPVRNSVPFMISKYHEITITFDSVAQTITLVDDMGTDDGGTDDTTTIIANNVTNLTFTYFDSFDTMVDVSTPLDWANTADQAELGSIRGVAIDITVRDQNETAVTTTLTSGVTLRNMGI